LIFQLSGANNFRSLHGLPTRDGRRIAGHRLLRSDQLHRLSEADWAMLQSLRLNTICDLRTGAEREKYPSNLPDAAMRLVPIELISDVRADPQLTEPLRASPDAEGAAAMMMELYRRFPDSLAPYLPTLFELLATDDAAVLIHCVAGKDRTGFAVALILHALGVEEESILADYLLSRRRDDEADAHRREMMARMVQRITERPASADMVDAILDARPSYLQAAFDRIAARHGSVEGYLRTCAGLDNAALQRLRDRMLEPA
jgi:protein-tyrosine phosphatase